MGIHFIKKIWSGGVDEQVHSQFTRFSRGKFENRTIINIRQGNKVKLTSSFELANELVLFLVGLAKTFAVSGTLLSWQNPQELLKELEINAEVKKTKKMFQVKIDTGLTSEQIEKLAAIAYFMLFNMHSEGVSLKIKSKLPKPGKSSEKINDKFCVLELDLGFFPQLHEEFLFDLPQDFDKARISHTYDIKQIIMPPGEKDYDQIRLKAVRQGRIVRKIEVDGKESIVGKDFKA